MAHIAVLNCDQPITGLSDQYKDLGDLCCRLLEDDGKAKLPSIKYTVYHHSDDVVEDEKQLNEVYLQLLGGIERKEIRGIFVSGSRADSFGEELWIKRLDEFLRTIFRLTDFPIVGVCFGHQIICKNLGCKVYRNSEGWECGTTTITLNTELFAINKLEWIKPLKDELKNQHDQHLNDHLNLPEMHADIVYGLPSSGAIPTVKATKFISIGSTAKCSIQGIITESGPVKILTFQGHPEFSTECTLEMLKNAYDTNHIDKYTFEKSVYNTKILNNQGPIISKFISGFFNCLSGI